MAIFASTLYSQNQPAGSGHGFNQITQHLHASVALPTTAVTGDTINFGYLPTNAVVFTITLKAQSQLDSNGAPALLFDVGDAASANRYMAASALVGRAAGASFDTTMSGGGKLFKTTAKTAIIGKVNVQAATAVAGVLEIEVAFFVEDTVGSAP